MRPDCRLLGPPVQASPVYIWHAPIDDWARAAADIATDSIPGVVHIKTAYDAYQRLQSGEEPVDVLMVAGGDALLGLIPIGKATRKLDKAEDVADAAGMFMRRRTEEQRMVNARGSRSRAQASARSRPTMPRSM